MTTQLTDYGLWWLVAINSAVFIIFAFSFFKPNTPRDSRSFSAFSAFLVALFTEMYGFPLTIYFLSGWLQSNYPDVNWLAHDSGHLPEMLFGWRSNPHFGPFHLLSFALVGGGFIMLSASWQVLYTAQRAGELATDGPYGDLRHPQYVAFVLIMLGFLFQWPTLLTVIMFPVLLIMYWRLSLSEEREAEAAFGDRYRRYAETTPRFLPAFRFGKDPHGHDPRLG